MLDFLHNWPWWAKLALAISVSATIFTAIAVERMEKKIDEIRYAVLKIQERFPDDY
jgi:hypothetical protein